MLEANERSSTTQPVLPKELPPPLQNGTEGGSATALASSVAALEGTHEQSSY